MLKRWQRWIGWAAAGVGALLLWRAFKRSRDPSLPGQARIDRALDRTLQRARRERIDLAPQHRFVFFSDHHKGARNAADDFQPCEETYLSALDHYLANDYTLVLLGDAEELWEEPVERVMAAYANVFASEARFYPDHYLRVAGNHDDLWLDPRWSTRFLTPHFPGIRVRDGLLLAYTAEEGATGELFLVHGHQGTLDSDSLSFISRLFLPLYRQFQILTGLGRTTPAQDVCLRAIHDTQMYRWARQQPQLALIAGHTHRPVWSSRTHLEKLLDQLWRLRQLAEKPPDFDEQVARLRAAIAEREAKYPPCIDTIKTSPTYFNTGCCRFADGDITGIELVDGQLALVKWGLQEGVMTRQVLEQGSLAETFFFL